MGRDDRPSLHLIPIDRARLARPAREVAPLLLGARFTHRTREGSVTVRLTEVEAYQGQGEDPGSHAHRGRTPRTAVMFGPPGHVYAYFTYGMHVCANVVTEREGMAAAVLLRAGDIVDGLDLARARRTTSRADVDLARGPARLASALAITLADNGVDVLAPPFELELPSTSPETILQGPRVGVSGPGGDAALFPWRFWIAGDPTVSQYRAAVVRRRATGR